MGDDFTLGRIVLNLLIATKWTIILSLIAFVVGGIVGFLVMMMRISPIKPVQFLSWLYVEFFQGTPLLLQLFVIFYLLPQIGVLAGSETLTNWLSLTPFTAAVIGLALNYSACEAENYRAGLLAVPRGQLEAALAVGMSWRTAMRRIVMPQAVRIVIPPVTNDFIALFKDTAVCSSFAPSLTLRKTSSAPACVGPMRLRVTWLRGKP